MEFYIHGPSWTETRTGPALAYSPKGTILELAVKLLFFELEDGVGSLASTESSWNWWTQEAAKLPVVGSVKRNGLFDSIVKVADSLFLYSTEEGLMGTKKILRNSEIKIAESDQKQ